MGAWTYSGVPWLDGHRYLVVARATDEAANVQFAFAVGVSSVSFNFNQTPPGVGLTNPDAARENNLATLSGTASDESGAAGLSVVQDCGCSGSRASSIT